MGSTNTLFGFSYIKETHFGPFFVEVINSFYRFCSFLFESLLYFYLFFLKIYLYNTICFLVHYVKKTFYHAYFFLS